MYEIDSELEILTRPAIISIANVTEIVKMDVVKNMGVGIWFADTDIPSIILNTATDKEAVDIITGFNRTKLKSKMKVIKKGK